MLWQEIVNGLSAAGIYILVSLGLTLVMSIMNIVQLAHGEIYMISAYIMYFLLISCGFPFWSSFGITVVLIGVGGIFLERIFFRPFFEKPDRALIISVGLILALQNIVLSIAGGVPRSFDSPLQGVFKIGRICLSWERVGIILLSLVLVGVLFLFLKKTKTGLAMMAIPQDRIGAQLQGIDIEKLSAMAMAIGCALAAVAGVSVGALFSISPTIGSFALMKGIAVIILGGLGSLKGAVLGGLILGLMDGIVPLFSSPYTSNILTLATVVIILLIKPEGLLGHTKD